MTQQEANEIIAAKLTLANALIEECEKIATDANVSFDFSVAYGMGGTFYPAEDKWTEAGWNPSSQSC